MFCSKCGQHLPENAGFCIKCGDKIEFYPTDSAPIQPPPQPGYPPNYQDTAAEERAAQVESQRREQQENTREAVEIVVNAIDSGMKSLINGVIIVVIVTVCVHFYPYFSDYFETQNPSLGISSSHLSQYSNSLEIGEAFDDFFGDTSWSNYTRGGATYVEHQGYCLYLEEKTLCTIRFLITDGDNSFRVDHIQMGVWSWETDNALDMLLIHGLFEMVFD